MKIDKYGRRLARRIGRAEARRVTRRAVRAGRDPEHAARKKLRS